MSSYIIRARQFAEMVYPFIKDCKNPYEYSLAIDLFNETYHRKVIVSSGQTRVALITSDYVLKIDYGTRGRIFGGCADECRAYQKAYNDGFGYLFARITPFMFNERIFYIMPRIKGIGYDTNGYDDVYEHVSDKERDYLYDYFEDLHFENYGWKNHRPVIVDYACWNGPR